MISFAYLPVKLVAPELALKEIIPFRFHYDIAYVDLNAD